MNTITVKVYEFDEESGTIVAGFSSDTTPTNNPDDYNKYAYQPANMWPDANTSDEIMTELARCGIGMCDEIIRNASYSSNTEKKAVLTGLVNTSSTKNVADITTSTDETDSEEV
tara:strand:- start:873 stop:1214 length:342 start_codon:yes stop_codon:yes gene_type:complete